MFTIVEPACDLSTISRGYVHTRKLLGPADRDSEIYLDFISRNPTDQTLQFATNVRGLILRNADVSGLNFAIFKFLKCLKLLSCTNVPHDLGVTYLHELAITNYTTGTLPINNLPNGLVSVDFSNSTYLRNHHLNYLMGIDNLYLSGTNITDTNHPALKYAQILNLSNTNITDVTGLRFVKKLFLANTPVTDVTALKTVHTLDLSYTNVSNVSALEKVHTLILAGTNVTDVSALGNMYKLDLSNTQVSDVSALGNVRKLILCNTPVSDVSALGSVHKLDLTNTLVTDFSKLGRVHKLVY